MALTDAQLTTLGNDIRANSNQTVIDALAAGAIGVIRDWYNGDASPNYWIYRGMVPVSEVRNAIDSQNLVDITTADLERAQALLDIRAEIGFYGTNSRDRSAWDDVFSAAAGDESQQAIAALWTKLATELEKAFKLDTGTGAANDADTSSVVGETVTTQEVDRALELTA